ncbi:hypothetical protein CVD28_01765 [Bacillus sp. M6-12]|uniref:hypothetical protein n=1 Tax=Bacillus sp. M6-12 TaxID=2054166 RepID=UPI000C7952EC|nr:hypothetical protein [Bacillus sp. M6-12]PLS19160.1 hypothetical protein CVD28_01765 [Bacillus sp. M6-12]
METYRMTIVFNDGIRPYHNRYTVGISDKEILSWIQNYANSYKQYKWFEFIEYLLVNKKSGAVYKGKMTK